MSKETYSSVKRDLLYIGVPVACCKRPLDAIPTMEQGTPCEEADTCTPTFVRSISPRAIHGPLGKEAEAT